MSIIREPRFATFEDTHCPKCQRELSALAFDSCSFCRHENQRRAELLADPVSKFKLCLQTARKLDLDFGRRGTRSIDEIWKQMQLFTAQHLVDVFEVLPIPLKPTLEVDAKGFTTVDSYQAALSIAEEWFRKALAMKPALQTTGGPLPLYDFDEVIRKLEAAVNYIPYRSNQRSGNKRCDMTGFWMKIHDAYLSIPERFLTKMPEVKILDAPDTVEEFEKHIDFFETLRREHPELDYRNRDNQARKVEPVKQAPLTNNQLNPEIEDKHILQPAPRKRGRKRKYDPKKDNQFCLDWQKAKGSIDFKLFCRDKKIRINEAKNILKRERVRKNRRKK